MFGVLMVKNRKGEIGYLAAYSGNIEAFGKDFFFVPLVYDLLQPDGFFKIEEAIISAINEKIREIEESGSFREFQQQLEEVTKEAENPSDIYVSLSV